MDQETLRNLGVYVFPHVSDYNSYIYRNCRLRGDVFKKAKRSYFRIISYVGTTTPKALHYTNWKKKITLHSTYKSFWVYVSFIIPVGIFFSLFWSFLNRSSNKVVNNESLPSCLTRCRSAANWWNISVSHSVFVT